MFGGVVGSVVDGGVSCCWFAVYVDLYCGGVSDTVEYQYNEILRTSEINLL